MSCSVSLGFFLILLQMSTVKIVLQLLNIDVRDDMRADIITANMRPRAPEIDKYKILHSLHLEST